MPPTDEQLLEAIATGDRAAFWEFYDRFAPRIFGLVAGVLRNNAEAEDVLQEVLLEVWRRADRYDPGLGAAHTWVLRMARSRAIDALRRRTRRPAAPLETADPHPASPASPPAGTAPELSADLADAMNRLPPEQRAVLHLAYARGLGREQIAEALGLPVGTVKTRIRLGVLRLAELLDAARERSAP